MPSATNPSLGTSFYYENLLNVTICSFFFLPREWNHMFLELCLCIYNFHFISIVFLQTKTKPNGCKSCGHYCEIARACPNPRALWSRNKNEILDNYRIITNVQVHQIYTDTLSVPLWKRRDIYSYENFFSYEVEAKVTKRSNAILLLLYFSSQETASECHRSPLCYSKPAIFLSIFQLSPVSQIGR